MRQQLTEEDWRFKHDPFLELHLLGLLDEMSVISLSDDNGINNIDYNRLNDLAKLSFFSFYYRHKIEQKDGHDWKYIIIDDQKVASLLTDESRLSSPVHSTHIRINPLEDMDHAFGHCTICPAKTFLGNNLGESNLEEVEGLQQLIEIPDTSEYSNYEPGKSKEEYQEQYQGECDNCQNHMSSWFATQISENSNYLWGLGGTGMVHNFSLNTKNMNILDIIAGREPMAEVSERDKNLSARTSTQLDEEQSKDPGPEYVFNFVLGLYLKEKMGFDDFKIDCEVSRPQNLTYEYDIILLDYEKKNIAAIETTAESNKNKNRIRKKQNAALQLNIFSDLYDGWDISYIYATSDNPDMTPEFSGTDMVQYHWELITTVTAPEDIDWNILDPSKAVRYWPEEFEEEISKFCLSIMHDCEEALREKLA